VLPSVALRKSPLKSAHINIIVDILVGTWILRLAGPGGQPRIEIMIISGFKAAHEMRISNPLLTLTSFIDFSKLGQAGLGDGS
jgi:predicted small integral membrane protein